MSTTTTASVAMTTSPSAAFDCLPANPTEREQHKYNSNTNSLGAASTPEVPLRLRTLEILWHCNERNQEAEQLGLHGSIMEGITSADYNVHNDRLLTTGGDGCLRMWKLHLGALATWMSNSTSDMTACTTHVCVMRTEWMPIMARWSPQGEMIVSAHCDGKVCLWWRERGSMSTSSTIATTTGADANRSDGPLFSRRVQDNRINAAGGDCSSSTNSSGVYSGSHAMSSGSISGVTGRPKMNCGGAEEVWKDYRHLAGHISDVYDACFSPDSRYVVSGGADGTVVIHDMEGSTLPVIQLSQAHHMFCRGVSWDAWGRYIHTTGAQPSLLVFTTNTATATAAAARTNNTTSTSTASSPVRGNRSQRIQITESRRCQGDFLGECCAFSFRRMSWSPDGVLLAVPYGKVPRHGKKNCAEKECRGPSKVSAAYTGTRKVGHCHARSSNRDNSSRADCAKAPLADATPSAIATSSRNEAIVCPSNARDSDMNSAGINVNSTNTAEGCRVHLYDVDEGNNHMKRNDGSCHHLHDGLSSHAPDLVVTVADEELDGACGPNPYHTHHNNEEESEHGDDGAQQEEEDEDEMLHCANIYLRGAPDKLACRLAIRGYNEVRGVQWAPCFFEPLSPRPSPDVFLDKSNNNYPHSTPARARELTDNEETIQPGPSQAAENVRCDKVKEEGAREVSGGCMCTGHVEATRAATTVATEATHAQTSTMVIESAVGVRTSSYTESWGPADYRMALALWTTDAVIVYTTDCRTRHSDFTDLHMRSITAVTWSTDARYLFTASLDGYISVIAFGSSLTHAHRLPLFSARPVTQAICAKLTAQREVGFAIEDERSTRVDRPGCGAAGPVVHTSVAVRKKRKVEKSTPVDTGSVQVGQTLPTVITASP